MNGLNLQQEAALAYAWMNQNDSAKDFSNLGISQAFIALRDHGMIKMQTDWGYSLVIFQQMLPAGSVHYNKARGARRRFETVSDEADCLMMRLAALDEEKRKSEDGLAIVTSSLDKPAYYAELSRCGLLDVKWADNKPYIVQLTDKGRTYVNGWFEEQMNKNNQSINFAPVINNNAYTSANASTEIGNVTVGMTVGAILDLDIDQALKDDAQDSVRQLDKAAKEKDITGFTAKLEKAASIAKSSAEIAGVVLPFVQMAIQTLMG
jgi:hypothetical protein